MEVNPSYPGPKRSGPDGERYRLKDPAFYDYALQYCLNCKRCEVACPSGVRVGDLIVDARLRYGSKANPLRDLMLADTDFTGSVAGWVSPVVNRLAKSSTARVLIDSFAGIDRHRVFPEYASKRFSQVFKDCGDGSLSSRQDSFNRHVTYFHGCYVEYNYPELGIELVKLMNACGYGVRLLDKEKCCGVALLAGGFRKKALLNAVNNVSAIRSAVSDGSEAVLTSGSSCTLMMRDEYPEVLGVDNSPVRDSLMLAVRFIYDGIASGRIRLSFKKGWKGSLAYHTACHMQQLGWAFYSISLLKMIPGLELTVLPQECCGISGTFGFKKENYRYSQQIGSKLFAAIRDSGAAAVVTDCETCKWQIEMSVGCKVYNPITVLYSALDLEKTAELNR